MMPEKVLESARGVPKGGEVNKGEKGEADEELE